MLLRWTLKQGCLMCCHGDKQKVMSLVGETGEAVEEGGGGLSLK